MKKIEQPAEAVAAEKEKATGEAAVSDTPVDAAIEPEEMEVAPLNISSSGQTPKHHRLLHWMKSHKAMSVLIILLLVLGMLAALPSTRYLLAGTVIRKDFSLVVVDAQTNRPVTSADVTLAGKTVTTDSQGRATIRAHVGNANLSIAKKYYRDSSATVLIPFNQKQPYNVTLEATGRQVSVTVVDRVGGKPVENAKVLAESSEVLTDKNGEATIVLPASSKEAKGSVSAEGYNKTNVTIKVTTSKDAANTFQLTPTGKLYFLSNASGKIDVVKSDLDGKNRETVLAGTGKEDKTTTALFASTDWKYLAFLSKRDSDRPKLHLIETSNDKMTVMDEGDANFTMVGWNGHQFVYKVARNSVKDWQPKKEALKSFDAETKKLAILDETTAEGDGEYRYLREYIGNAFILDGEILYSKNWSSSGFSNAEKNKQATLNSVKQTPASKRAVKSFTRSDNYFPSLDIRPYGPNELYIYTYDGSRSVYYEYENGKVEEEKDLTDTAYYSSYPTYLISPDAKRTFWNDSRDGKDALFVGGKNAESAKQIALLKDYRGYGWYTDKYVLLSKEGSELYIMPDKGLQEGEQPSKVSDYYRPDVLYDGYGRGYGGL